MTANVRLADPTSPDPAEEPTPSPWASWCGVHETHSGVVLLMGDRAYKFKKPVNLGFLDFTGRDQRRATCERELELNRRLAPDVYLGVGDLVDPSGDREPVLVMRRLPEDKRLSHLVRSGIEVRSDISRIARAIATFHAGAATGPDVVACGTRAALRRRWQANLAESAEFSGRLIDADVFAEVSLLVTRYLDGREDLFVDRITRGAIIDGHGDLTADDIFCLPDGPRLLDCLEFDDRLRYVDRLDDIAFLAMGLGNLGAADEAHQLVAEWAEYLDDPVPDSLLHHFIAYRSFVRAKVGCLRAVQRGLDHAPDVDKFAADARRHLREGAVKLVLVGGSPGSGKSTVAGAVADRLGMTVLSSDRLRKELAGIDPETSAAAPLHHGIYDAAHNEVTYRELVHRADVLLRRGESVVLDASWTRAADRELAAVIASDTSSDLVELRCEIDPATAAVRIRERRGVSDADAVVAAALRAGAEPWPSSQVVDTRDAIELTAARACALIRPVTNEA